MIPLQAPQQFIKTEQDLPGNTDLWLDISTTRLGIAHFFEFADFMKRAWNIDDTSYQNLYVALSEALTNSADHGNKWVEEKQIHIHARRDEEHYIISITDEGDGFNYKRIGNPTDIENRIKAGGRGVFIMNYLADNVQYSENGKRVVLFFRRIKHL